MHGAGIITRYSFGDDYSKLSVHGTKMAPTVSFGGVAGATSPGAAVQRFATTTAAEALAAATTRATAAASLAFAS